MFRKRSSVKIYRCRSAAIGWFIQCEKRSSLNHFAPSPNPPPTDFINPPVLSPTNYCRDFFFCPWVFRPRLPAKRLTPNDWRNVSDDNFPRPDTIVFRFYTKPPSTRGKHNIISSWFFPRASICNHHITSDHDAYNCADRDDGKPTRLPLEK